MLDFYTSQQLPSGQMRGYDDCAYYCKLPLRLLLGGRVDEADRMLTFCKNNFLTPNGDFMNDNTLSSFDAAAKTLHWEFADFYPYLNQWWITCGVRLGRFDFVDTAYQYVDRHWFNPVTAASVVQDPLGENPEGYNEHCIFNSAHLGNTYLFMGNKDKALAVGDTICKMVDAQPDLEGSGDTLRFYMRFNDDFQLIKGYPEGARGVKNAAICKGNEAFQCWWSLGYPVAYLANVYNLTGEAKYLASAEKILAFCLRCNENLRHNIVSHKVMWGAAMVGAITGRKQYWDLSRDIASHIMNVGQVESGEVKNWQWERDEAGNGTVYGEAQVIDQTGEIAYWFSVVARLMEQAELDGKLN